MTGEQLRQLEAKLWEAADDLRANSKLNASEYSMPVLGLIFLRHAYSRFAKAKIEIEKRLPTHPQRGQRAINKADFVSAKAMFLPENAQWKNIVDTQERENMGEIIDNAMKSIEDDNESLSDVLPKNYQTIDEALLRRLVRIFDDKALDDVEGDVFGRIYEYFLNKFGMSSAQEGGEFFTPPSLVNTIVRILEPNHGIILDPACGSAGMFVQTGHFIEKTEKIDAAQKVSFYGQEKAELNTKLAKMNMAVHGLEAKIMEGNTFYVDHHNLVGKCDFVMANPPFNVDGVDKESQFVKKDARLPFGIPEKDSANYLWIQYFYQYLNENGRAGFVMASSAATAGHSEQKIREKLIATGAVDVMVEISAKFFYTRAIPCSLWFLDKAKDEQRKNQTLMLDLREVYRVVSRRLYDFSEEHLTNIQAIVGLYRGKETYFKNAVKTYRTKADEALKTAQTALENLKNYETPEQDLDSSEVKETLTWDNAKNNRKRLNAAYRNWLQALNTITKKDDVFKKDKERKTALKIAETELAQIVADFNTAIETAVYFNKNYYWLTERFPNGKYNDVAGLCKIATQTDIKNNDFSLSAGGYVGVAPRIADDADFEERMGEIKTELNSLKTDAWELANRIDEHLNELL